MLFKIDFKKVCARVDWDFFLFIISKMIFFMHVGFSGSKDTFRAPESRF